MGGFQQQDPNGTSGGGAEADSASSVWSAEDVEQLLGGVNDLVYWTEAVAWGISMLVGWHFWRLLVYGLRTKL